MTIPITFSKNQSGSDAPQGNTIPAVAKFRSVAAIWSAAFITGSQKDEHLLPF
jgi:hypothetical protein